MWIQGTKFPDLLRGFRGRLLRSARPSVPVGNPDLGERFLCADDFRVTRRLTMKHWDSVMTFSPGRLRSRIAKPILTLPRVR